MGDKEKPGGDGSVKQVFRRKGRLDPGNLIITVDLKAYAEIPDGIPPLPEFLPHIEERTMEATDTTFHHQYNPQRKISGERRLMLAILSNAINDLNENRHQVDRQDALNWIEGKLVEEGEDLSEYPFTFENICDELGFDSDTLSKTIVERIYNCFERVSVRVKATK